MMRKTFLLAMVGCTFAFAQNYNVELDTSFGVNGSFELIENSKNWGLPDMIENADGTIVVSAQKINGSNPAENTIIRLTSSGQLDPGFGTGGYVTGIGTAFEEILDVKKQPDGKMLLYNGLNPYTKITRLLSNGQLDTSFGANGVVSLNGFEQANTALDNTLLIQNNGVVIIKKAVNQNIKSISRYSSDGTLDSSFGTNGTINNVQGNNIFLDNNSNIISFKSSGNTYTIEKFDTNGQVVSSFGTNGVLTVTAPVSLSDIGHMYMDSQNRLLAVISNNKLMRINSDGTYDNTFSYIPSNNQAIIYPIAENNNKYIVGGGVINNPYDILISRLGQNALLDLTFNTTGSYTDSNAQKLASAIIAKNDNTILVAGIRNVDSANNICKVFVTKYKLVSTLNTSETNAKANLIFNNPVKDELRILSSKNIESVTLFSMDGKIIAQSKGNTLNTSKLEKGLYIGKVSFFDQSEKTIKIIK